jgi:hypothetical protein
VKGDNGDLAARNKDVVETRLKKLVCAGQQAGKEKPRFSRAFVDRGAEI